MVIISIHLYMAKINKGNQKGMYMFCWTIFSNFENTLVVTVERQLTSPGDELFELDGLLPCVVPAPRPLQEQV